MRLKSIELMGFKSFPDVTRLNFERGMTVVVGPNGSGKSNISDAIRWVLGEISAKSVRGTRMEDVIFGGTDSRKQKAFAEVSLTIDNSETECRLDTDFDEITVTRRCSRSGESEYMINRRPVRLKDISELFMNTGVGRMGYSIIGQGKIAEIISQRSDERRSIFEEVAGISKYRYKKNEAEHKITALDENLYRIKDILNELSSRIEPLEKESLKARKYLELYAQKKQTDISLFLYDIENIRKQTKESQLAFETARNELENADNILISLEKQSEHLFDASQENKLKIEQISGRIKEYNDRRQKNTNSRSVLENDILHIKDQIIRAESDLGDKTAEQEAIQKKSRESEAEYLRINDILADYRTRFESTDEILQSYYRQRAALEDAMEKSAGQIADRAEELTSFKIKLSALNNSLDHVSARNDELLNEIAEYTESSGLIESRIARTENTISEYKEKIRNINENIRQTENESELLQREQKSLFDEIYDISLEISGKKQRADTLKRMEEHFEGYVHSVRQVMRASEERKLNGILGPVSHIFEVIPQYALAVETAIGANIQNIVVENEESAKKAIEYLKQNNAGRATFYPLTSIKSSPLNPDIENIKKFDGFIGIASDLVTFDKTYREIIGYLLGRTVVADNLDHASIMAKASGYRIRIVTTDGQLINTGGSFTGGSVKKDSGILTRGSETEKLESEITHLKIKIKAKEKAAGLLNDTLNELKNKTEKLAENAAMLNAVYQAENTQLQVLRSQYSGETNRLEICKKEYGELGERTETGETLRNSVLNNIQAAETDISLLKNTAAGYETDHKSVTKKIVQKQDEYNSLRLKMTAQQKDLESAERTVRFNSETIHSVGDQIEKTEQNLFVLNETMIAAQNKTETLTLEIKALEADILQLENTLSSLTRESRERDENLQELLSHIREKTHLRDNLFREYNRFETQLNKINTEQDRITAKLWDDYELTYTSAAELGYPKTDGQKRPADLILQNDLRNKMRALGPVNTGVIDEYNDVKSRHVFLLTQLDDLNKSKENLTDIIYRLEHEMRQRFSDTMVELSRNFKNVFRELFGGGSAELILTDPGNILESGIEINVAPPGKIIKNLNLLSGGEQAFVAIALLFAILNVNPTPFCVLDEIEAALDDINVDRFADYIRRYSEKTQFVIITHRRGTMERADTIYGVTMPERGISKILALNVNEVEQMIGVKL